MHQGKMSNKTNISNEEIFSAFLGKEKKEINDPKGKEAGDIETKRKEPIEKSEMIERPFEDEIKEDLIEKPKEENSADIDSEKKIKDLKQNKRKIGKEITGEEVKELKEKKEMSVTVIVKEIEKRNDDAAKIKPVEKKITDDKGNTGEEQKKRSEEKTEVLGAGEEEYPYFINQETGEIVEINKAVFRIGKSSEYGDYVIQGNKSISRKHLEVLKKNSKFYVKDKNSTNGTYIDEYRIPPETEVEIKDNQEIRIANVKFLFKSNM